MDLARVEPPPGLASRIGGRIEDYHEIGRGQADLLRAILPETWSWSGKRILDFGCGTGRTLVQFSREAATAEFWGCDIDAPSIDWALAHLVPPFNFIHNQPEPPLELADATFDLVYGFSVFTHLVDTWSDWLLEMHRLLAVGGYGIFSFLGEGMIGEVAGRAWDAGRIGMIGLDIGKPWAIGGPNVLLSEWWLREHWGRAFEIIDVWPYTDRERRAGHGLILFRKDGRPTPTRHDLQELSDDPREIASLRFATELLGERMARLWSLDQAFLTMENERLRAELAALQQSKSWRLTAPLRSVRRRLG